MLNPELLHYAKQNAKQIKRETKNILFEHQLVVFPSTIGFEIAQYYPEWVNELPEKINFGSHPLKLKQVKQIIQDNEQLNYL